MYFHTTGYLILQKRWMFGIFNMCAMIVVCVGVLCCCVVPSLLELQTSNTVPQFACICVQVLILL